MYTVQSAPECAIMYVCTNHTISHNIILICNKVLCSYIYIKSIMSQDLTTEVQLPWHILYSVILKYIKMFKKVADILNIFIYIYHLYFFFFSNLGNTSYFSYLLLIDKPFIQWSWGWRSYPWRILFGTDLR